MPKPRWTGTSQVDRQHLSLAHGFNLYIRALGVYDIDSDPFCFVFSNCTRFINNALFRLILHASVANGYHITDMT